MQTDGRTVVNGVLTSDLVAILGGYLGGSGLIDAQTVVIGAGATVNPGNSPGALHVTGDWQQQSLSTLYIEIVSPTVHDVLDVQGIADFASDSRIFFVLNSPSGLYVPGDGDDIEFLLAEGLTGLGNISYSISGLSAGFHYQVYVDGQSDLHVRFYGDGSGSESPPGYVHAFLYDGQVPVPSTLALCALGCALMGWRVRRRNPGR